MTFWLCCVSDPDIQNNLIFCIQLISLSLNKQQIGEKNICKKIEYKTLLNAHPI